MERRWIRAGLVVGTLLTIGYSANLYFQFQKLDRAFHHQDEFVPTRIYSDVWKISTGQPRSLIQKRLEDLVYETQQPWPDRIQFILRPISYPTYLIPEGHATHFAQGKLITLHFTGEEKDAPLLAILVEDQEVSELYLEPQLVSTLSRGSGGKIRDPLKFGDIPSIVSKAIIAVEDPRFLDHKGFDPRGIARAIVVNLKTLSFAQGGSTITQQLVKNLMVRRTKNLFHKLNELFLSLMLEFKYEKEQILERYLNEVYLGQVGSLEVHGVAEGAEHFFGRSLNDLNVAEVAMMAGLIRGPGYYSPYRHRDRAIERSRWVLKKMVESGHLAAAEAESAIMMPIRLIPPRNIANQAPYFTDFVKAELIRRLKDRGLSEAEITSAGFRVYTTLDVHMNDAAQRAVADGITSIEKKYGIDRESRDSSERIEGALAAVENGTGHIRALIGGRSYGESTFNRILNMKRQVGSTFKPFVYLAAFEKGYDRNGVPYSPGHPVEDAHWKLTFDSGRQTWEPRNYEKEFIGWTSFRTALAHSINTVTARLGVEVGIENVIETARALGIQSDLPPYPSLSLGVAELSPVELLRAYAVLANRGIEREIAVIRAITLDNGNRYAQFIHHPQEVYAEGPIDLLTDVLQNVFSEGTARRARSMGFLRPAAGKTGTTSHHRDAWFAGYTPELTAVVWVGMDQTPVAKVDAALDEGEESEEEKTKKRILLTGGGSALPIWVDFMREALRGTPPTPFPLSPHLIEHTIDRKTGHKAFPDCPPEQTTVEKFLIGVEPQGYSCEATWPASIHETTLEY